MVREEMAYKLSFRPVMGPVALDPVVWLHPPIQWTRASKLTGHTSPSRAEVKNMWSYSSASPLCHYGVDRDSLYLYTWTYPKYLGAPHSIVSPA
jgi:hypothetical protein